MKDKNLNFVDRFLYKLLIGFFLLLVVVVLDYFSVFGFSYQGLKNTLNRQFNILKVVEVINGNTNAIIPLEIDKDVAVDASAFEEIVDIENGKRMILGDYNAVECLMMGVVVKLKHNQDGSYLVVIKGADDLEYHYDCLESVDVHIYQMIKANDIIGKASYDDKNYYNLYIYNNSKAVDYFS